jgi:outer membrane protein OmpA-like peptidoglycan-associated protein
MGTTRHSTLRTVVFRLTIGLGLALCALGTLPLWPATARAQQADSRLGLEIKAVVSGDAMPAFVIQPQEDLKQLTVGLTRSDGEVKKLSSGAVRAGQRRELSVDQPLGKFSYKAEFRATWASGDPSTFAMTVELTRVGKLELQLAPSDVDLDARTMTFRMNNPAQSAELTLVGNDGKPMATVQKDYNGAAGGTALSLAWDAPPAELLYMDLKVTDVGGFWKVVRLSPFAVKIPHDDVKFDTDKANIKPSEEPKLEASLKLIKEALDKHGKQLQVKLFVAGYTDTVGGKEHNQRLSDARAHSIAAWFRGKGVKIPIYSQGFGEDALAKPTPDETPEPANRRALYLLASQRPAVSSELPRDAWKEL